MVRLAARMTRYAAGTRMARHADGCRRLSVLVSGRQEEVHGRGLEPACVGSVALKDADFVHRNRFGPAGTTVVAVLLPDETVEALGHRAAALEPGRWHHHGPVTLSGLRLAVALRRRDGAAVEECLHELLAAFAPSRSAEPDPAAGRLRRIRDRLHDEPDLAPSMRRLAAEEGVHPGSLGRAFRRAFGCSITRYRQRLRAAAVARVLISGEESLVGVALDHGFSDLSHMTRVFRRELGVPPGGFRAWLGPPRDGLESFKTEWDIDV